MAVIRTSRTSRTSRSARLSAALAALVLTGLVCASPSAAEAAPEVPQLSIAVDDARPSAAPSDELVYKVSVTNLGTRPVKGLIITQTIPDGAALRSTDPRSSGNDRTVSWSVDVGPGKKAATATTVTVAKTLPDGLLRLATVACARTTTKGAPLVCASDSDQLPAGAAADTQRQELEQRGVGHQGWWPLPAAPVLGGLVLATVAAILLLLLRRRGRGQGPSGPARAADSSQDLMSSSRR